MNKRWLVLIAALALLASAIGIWQWRQGPAPAGAALAHDSGSAARDTEPALATPPPTAPALTITTVTLQGEGGAVDAQLTGSVAPDTFDALTPAAEFDEAASSIFATFKTSMPRTVSVDIVWRRLPDEFGAPGGDLEKTSVYLPVGERKASELRASGAGFLPGNYELELAFEGETARRSLPFRVRSAYAPASLVLATEGVAGLNVAVDALGGRVVSAPDSSKSENWRAENLIDGFPFRMGGGGGCAVCGWTSREAEFPHDFVFAFAQGREVSIDSVVIDPSTEDTSEGDWPRIPRSIEVWTSRTSATADFTQVASARLAPRPTEQLIKFAATPAKFVKIRVLSNWGGTSTQFGEIRILEAAGVSALADLPRNIARPPLGGVVARFTSQAGAFGGVQSLIDGELARPWESADHYLPQDIVLAFKDDQSALIDRVILNPTTRESPDNFPKLVSLATSSSDLFAFEDIGKFTLPKEARDHVLPVNREARFLRVRILENHGGSRTSVNEIQVIEGSRPGYASVLTRAERFTPATVAPNGNAVGETTAGSEREPNDAFGQANELVAGTPMAGAIQPTAEKDHFAIGLAGDARQVLTLDVVGTPYVRTSIALLDEHGKPSHRFDPSAVVAPATTISWLVPGGRRVIEVTEPPPSLVLIWDTSGSMLGRTDQLKEAVHAYLSQVQPTERLNLIRFSADVEVLLPAFTSDVAALTRATEGKFVASGGTRLHDAVLKAIELLEAVPGNRAIVLMSDGEDSGSEATAPAFWKVLQDKRIRLYTIGLGVALKGFAPSIGSTGQRFLGHLSLATNGRTFLARTTDELKGLYQRIASELREPARYRLTARASAATGQLSLTATGERIAAVSAPSRIELVLDASGSMRRRLGNRPMIDAAKEMLATVIANLPDDVEVGLRVYGHRVREGQPAACQDSELVQPLAKLDRTRLLAKVRSIQALGTTPIAYTLTEVGKDLARVDGEKMVILVTDGKEECGGDPKAALAALEQQGLKVRINIVGFALTDEATQRQMAELAQLTGGAYFNARDDRALAGAMAQAMAVGFSVRDSANAEVVAGRVGGEPVTLPEGTYSVTVQTADNVLTIPNVRVVANKQTGIALKKEGREVGIQVHQP